MKLGPDVKPTPLLEAVAIRKVYPGGTVANDGVDLVVRPGEIHAVVGENGAGKSTLMKVLYGIEQPDGGELRLGGTGVAFPTPRDAIAAGIGMVFQHFSLVPSYAVYENVVLGVEPRKGIRFDRAGAVAEVRALSDRFRLPVDPHAVTSRVPVGQQQRVEILKALYRDARILILDEPTAVLAPQEVVELFGAIRSLAALGRSVIFIAHKLPEVLEIADRITVMRGGKTIGTVDKTAIDETGLARMMVGQSATLRVDPAVSPGGETACRVDALAITDARGTVRVAGLDLRIRSGEILGIAAVEGNGQSELMEAIEGLVPVQAGRVTLGVDDITSFAVLDRRNRGLASIPQDRIATGLAIDSTLAENFVATRLEDLRFVRHGLLDLSAIEAHASDLIELYGIRASGPHVPAATLSGGNMQKCVVARELSEQPKLLLVSQPTRGVDLGATQFIWRSIAEARDKGAAVLLYSADLSELLALSDRIIVLYRGRLAAAFRNSDELTQETVGAAMLGLESQSAQQIEAALQ